MEKVIPDPSLEKGVSHLDNQCRQKMDKKNSRQRFSSCKSKAGMRSLQEFCKKIKFWEGHEAGRWEGVEESLDFVRSLQMAHSLGVALGESRARWNIPWLSAEESWARTIRQQLSDFGTVCKWGLPHSKG